jgi:alginate O-acetyltransferase complex protein AlgJ
VTGAALRRLFEIATIGLFAVALVAPIIRQQTSDGPSVSMELRSAAPPPVLGWDPAAIRAVPAATERFLADRFGFRHQLIGVNNLVMLFGLGVSPVDDLVVGKNGWVFYDANESLAVGRGLRPFTFAELEGWRCTLEARRDWLAARAAAYVFVVAPDKHTIYPDLLPDYLARVGKHTRFEQLLDHMAAHSSVTIVDVRPAMAAARREHPIVYYPHGTHWNDIGAWAAYREVMEAAHAALPAIVPRWRDEPMLVPTERAKESWDRRLHIDGRLTTADWTIRDPEPNWTLVYELKKVPRQRMTEIPSAPTPRVVVVHDSFAVPWQRWMSQHLGYVAYLWQAELDYAFVSQQRPDLVIQEHVERHLWPPPVDLSAALAEHTTPWTPDRPPLAIPPRPRAEPAPCPTPGVGETR